MGEKESSVKLSVFENSELGSVRAMLVNGEPFFVGKDVASILGYAKPENAIAAHVDDEDKTTTLIQGTGSNYKSNAVLINESGLYSLILSSKLPAARKFKSWVTSEVLPSIRRPEKKMEMTIKIRKENGFNAVLARELHEKLGIKTRFNDWIERMIAYGFEAEKDYITVTQKRVTVRGNETEYMDYVISLDMAKEICMIQRSDTGRKFRQYFIECEKELNRKTETCNVPHMSEKEIDARNKEYNLGVYDRLHSLANEYAEKSEAYRQVLDAHATKALAGEFLLPLPETEKTYSATEIGDMLGISANKVGKIANANGMKTAEFGKFFIDKSKFAAKEVQTFRYNRKALDRIRQLAKGM